MSSAARAKTAQPNNERSMHTIMKRRRILNMLGIMAAAVATAGCSSSMYSSSSPVASDDLYATHDRKALMEAEIERRAQEIAAERPPERLPKPSGKKRHANWPSTGNRKTRNTTGFCRTAMRTRTRNDCAASLRRKTRNRPPRQSMSRHTNRPIST